MKGNMLKNKNKTALMGTNFATLKLLFEILILSCLLRNRTQNELPPFLHKRFRQRSPIQEDLKMFSLHLLPCVCSSPPTTCKSPILTPFFIVQKMLYIPHVASLSLEFSWIFLCLCKLPMTGSKL